MVVTDRKLKVHREIDMVTTPSGKAVAMVHCNNCTTDINSIHELEQWRAFFQRIVNEEHGIKDAKTEVCVLRRV